MSEVFRSEHLIQYETYRKWASRIKISPSYNYVLCEFINYLRVKEEYSAITPDDLVERQLDLSKRDEFKILDQVQGYVRSKKARYGTKNTYYKQIRSFFLHNRAGLPRDPSFNIRGDTPPVNGHLTPEEVRAVLLSSNKLHRAVFLCMLQAGLDRDMLCYWNEHGWESLRCQLMDNLDPIKLELPGRKSMKFQRPYYSFITSDAIKAIREYLPKKLPEKRKAIFINQRGNPVTGDGIAYYWKYHMKKVAQIEHIHEDENNKAGSIRYGKNLHELRDTFKTLCSKSEMKYEISEFFLGHVVDPLGYDKSSMDEDYYRRQYMEASEFLNIMSKTKAYGLVKEEEAKQEEMENLKAQVASLSKALSKVMEKLEENES